MTTKVTILAPAFNEEEVITDFVMATMSGIHSNWELLIIDDGSTDATPAMLQSLEAAHPRLRVITHEVNRGLGAALKTGFQAARGEVVVTMDADLSHPLTTVPGLVKAVREADAAFGSRFVPGGGMVGIPKKRAAISVVGNLVFRLLFATRTRDLTTGLRAYRTEVVRGLSLNARGFAIQLEITANLIAQGRRIVELPLVLTPRPAGESKMRYLRLLPSYVSTLIAMTLLRWKGALRATRDRDPELVVTEPELDVVISLNDTTTSVPEMSGQGASQ